MRATTFPTALLLLLGLASGDLHAGPCPGRSIAVGGTHTIVAAEDGTVWGSGSNFWGQLGLGPEITTTRFPTQIEGLAGIDRVGAGSSFAIALGSDGSLWGWGDNGEGQLGLGHRNNQDRPQLIEEGVIAADAGQNNLFFVLADGTVWGVGINFNGDVTPGGDTFVTTPEQHAGLSDIADIVVAAATYFAIKADGSVRVWGYNGTGMFGDGTMTSNLLPVDSLIDDVVSLSASERHVLALKSDGTVWAWGDNLLGQVGDGGMNDYVLTPWQVPVGPAVAVAAMPRNSYVALEDGTLLGWGSRAEGLIGPAEPTLQLTPAPMSIEGVPVRFASGDISSWHAGAILDDGAVVTWGRISTSLGRGWSRPTPLESLTGVVEVEAGSGWSAVLRDDGTVWTWGEDDAGQLGQASPGDRTIPVPVTGLGEVSSIDVGGRSILALLADGRLMGWGSNSDGQLGDGTRTTTFSPVEVTAVTDVESFAMGWNHSVALDASGQVWAWGDNTHGQVGDGTTDDVLTPVPIAGLPEIQAVAAGIRFTLALGVDGRVRAWGSGEWGQIGDGRMLDSAVPLLVPGIDDAVAVFATGRAAYALHPDGSVSGWGVAHGPSPVLADELTGMVDFQHGSWGSLVRHPDGRVLGWGSNSDGILANGTDLEVPIDAPTLATGLPSVVELSLSAAHALALTADGRVWSWGHGEIGDVPEGPHVPLPIEACPECRLPPIEVSPAGTTTPLLVTTSGSSLVVDYAPVVGATRHAVARGTIGNWYDHVADAAIGAGSCDDGTSGSFVDDDDLAEPGNFYYLVSAARGECEGTTGHARDSSGAGLTRPDRLPSASCP